MIIDHIGFSVSDPDTSNAFYSTALAPLGIVKIIEVEGWSGFGKNGKPEFWFGKGESPQLPIHIAFVAENRTQVDEFYRTALTSGGTDNGAPGIREITWTT